MRNKTRTTLRRPDHGRGRAAAALRLQLNAFLHCKFDVNIVHDSLKRRWRLLVLDEPTMQFRSSTREYAAARHRRRGGPACLWSQEGHL